MANTKSVYLVMRELYSHNRVGNVTEDTLVGIFPLVVFAGTDMGLSKVKAYANDLNRERGHKTGGIVREHHSSSESRYWCDCSQSNFQHDSQVFVVRRVDKK